MRALRASLSPLALVVASYQRQPGLTPSRGILDGPMAAHSYASILRDAQKARWSLDEVSEWVHRIDFTQPFLPNALVRVDELAFLDPEARRYANQIRAHSYVRLFALVERFILPFVMLHAGESLHRSSEELLALMQFGEEEAKHIALFERFSESFELGFGAGCEVVGPADEIANSVLAEDPLAIGLAVLHIEWMTQDHFLRSVRGAEDIDPSYKNLLRCHWAEEAQHAKLDALLIEKGVLRRSEPERERAVRGYLGILGALEAALRQQVELDIEAFVRAGGSLTDAQRDAWRALQAPAYNEAFLRAGLVHPRLKDTIDRHFPNSDAQLAAAAERWQFRVAG